MRLLVQPEHGVSVLTKAIDSAERHIEIAIFRLDHGEIKRALERAVRRGVTVQALIADKNHDGDNLRGLEQELLSQGVEVSRTSDGLRRHHYKFMVIDRRVLYFLTFNYTHLDIEHSRSFGLVIDDPAVVDEAITLFFADVRRKPYQPRMRNFVVSPINARERLADFIRQAKKQLLIYDPEISDRSMIHLLRESALRGVEIRIIGRVSKPSRTFEPARLMRLRFHTRTILRDKLDAFLGSQSLRESELDSRRELGVIIDDHDIVRSLAAIFESDWAGLVPSHKARQKGIPKSAKSLRRSVKALVRELPLAPIVQLALEHAVDKAPNLELRGDRLRHNLADAVKDAVEEAVSTIVGKEAAVPA